MVSDWREIPFKQLLAEPVRNGIYKKKEFHGRGVKIVNMGELFANPRLRNIYMKRVELSETERHRLSVQTGDLLFARRSLVAEVLENVAWFSRRISLPRSSPQSFALGPIQ